MSDPNNINYEPLQALNGAWQVALRSTIKLWGPIIVAAFAAVALLATPFLAFDALIGLGVLYGIVLATNVRKLKNGMWWQFAAVNGWWLDTETPPGAVIPPSLQFGHDQNWSPIVQTQLGDLVCDILTYRCITGYDDKSERTHHFTIACAQLPAALPHILLLSKKSRIDVRHDLGNGEDLQLEGDFGNYFSLQIEKGDEVNVLTLITPDVMQTLVAYSQGEDIEIVGNKLYFITGNDKRDYHDIQLIIRSVAELGQTIADNLKRAAPAAKSAAAV